MSVVKRSSDGYWTQRVDCEVANTTRDSLICSYSNGKILHVGCTDYPLSEVGRLHNILVGQGHDVDGYDIDSAGIQKLRELLPSYKFFDNVTEINNRYSVVLMPDVVEHVFSPLDFFRGIDRIEFERFLVSVPNALQNVAEYRLEDNSFIEMVHPDHKYWFSPYTICNLIESCTEWKIEKVQLVNRNNEIIVTGTKR